MTNLISTNPAKNYQKIGEVKISALKEIQEKVKFANDVKKNWKELGVKKRIELLRPLLKEYIDNKDEIALLTTQEIGKPISQSYEDWDFDKEYLGWFLEYGEECLKPEVSYQDNKTINKVIYEPIGTAAVIVPWNYPFSNFMWGVIPNLIAGNTVVLKHSEECPLSGKLFEEMMDKLKLPNGVFSEIYGDGKVGEILVNQEIDFIWFTGSSFVGKKLYEIAGHKLIKSVLEMGGSNPGIVFENANIDKAVESIYAKRYSNCGQICDALKRLIVHESIFNEVVEKLKTLIETKVVSDPKNKNTDIGSLVCKKQLNILKSQVDDALKKGAKLIIGGKQPRNLKGAYYLPTVLTNIKKNMDVWQEEVFGPVLPVIPFKTEEEAINLANDTIYGLGAYIYAKDNSKDKNQALRIASKINAGAISINDANHFNPSTPFGGYKESGMGREHGKYGFHELCQIKVIATD